MRINATAGPVGRRRPCSQFCTVRTLTFSSRANCACVSRVRYRICTRRAGENSYLDPVGTATPDTPQRGAARRHDGGDSSSFRGLPRRGFSPIAQLPSCCLLNMVGSCRRERRTSRRNTRGNCKFLAASGPPHGRLVRCAARTLSADCMCRSGNLGITRQRRS
jgi:hypothetical protein